MKNSIKKSTILLLLAILIGCGPRKQQLNVFTFTDYIDSGIVAEFEKRYDCKVVLDFFNSGDVVMAKLAAGGESTYDVVCVGDGEVPNFVRLGLLAELRAENLPNLKNLDRTFTDRTSDPRNQHSIPYSWSFMGIFARRPAGPPLEESWSLLFDPSRQRGSFLLVDDSRACIAAALCSKGYSVNTTNLAELAEARDLLVDAKRRSSGFESPVSLRNRVYSKSASLVMTLSGDDSSNPADPETYFFTPREGSFAGLDRLAVPAKAPHRDLAEAFLNFILSADIGARNAKTLGGATANLAAKSLLPLEIQNDPFVYPSAETMSRLQFIQDVGAQTKLYDELWTQIKAK